MKHYLFAGQWVNFIDSTKKMWIPGFRGSKRQRFIGKGDPRTGEYSGYRKKSWRGEVYIPFLIVILEDVNPGRNMGRITKTLNLILSTKKSRARWCLSFQVITPGLGMTMDRFTLCSTVRNVLLGSLYLTSYEVEKRYQKHFPWRSWQIL